MIPAEKTGTRHCGEGQVAKLVHDQQPGLASVALYITAAYWFISSTSFANPAITIARSLSDSFAGITPACVPGFVAAQILGALAAHFAADLLFIEKAKAIA